MAASLGYEAILLLCISVNILRNYLCLSVIPMTDRHCVILSRPVSLCRMFFDLIRKQTSAIRDCESGINNVWCTDGHNSVLVHPIRYMYFFTKCTRRYGPYACTRTCTAIFAIFVLLFGIITSQKGVDVLLCTYVNVSIDF